MLKRKSVSSRQKVGRKTGVRGGGGSGTVQEVAEQATGAAASPSRPPAARGGKGCSPTGDTASALRRAGGAGSAAPPVY